MKVRQISQGVEDIRWQNKLHGHRAEEGIEEESGTMAGDGDGLLAAAEIEEASSTLQETQTEQTQLPEDAEMPPESNTSSLDSVMDAPTVSSDEPPPTGPILEHPISDSEVAEKEQGLKRKMGDRAVSQGPPNTLSDSEPLKRLRDDADNDDAQRESKRPSPPPQKEAEQSKPTPPPPTPKLVCGPFHFYFSMPRTNH